MAKSRHIVVLGVSQMPFIPPRSGRACVRKFQNVTAIIGVMHFDENQFHPAELSSYPLAYSFGGYEVSVGTEMLKEEDASQPSHSLIRLEDFATPSPWRSFDSADMHIDSVRFTKLRDEENSYSLLSISEKNPFAHHPTLTKHQNETHFFVEFRDGYTTASEQQKFPTTPNIMGLLRNFAIWPDENGILKTASDLSTHGRKVFDQVADLHFKKITSTIDEITYLSAIDRFKPYTTANVINDKTLAQIIKMTHEWGMNRPSGYSYTQDEYRKHQSFISAAARAIINKSVDHPTTLERLRSITGNTQHTIQPRACKDTAITNTLSDWR